MMGNQIDYSTSLITEREDAIADIESTMLEVNEIYRDLSTLVVEQGQALGETRAHTATASTATPPLPPPTTTTTTNAIW